MSRIEVGGPNVTDMTSVSPTGSWPTPITSELVVRAAARLGEVVVDGDDIWWSESRPAEGGRSVIVRRSPDGTVTDALPAPWNARTRVHEYGGGSWTVQDGTLWFTEFTDQRLYRLDAGGDTPVAVTPEPSLPAGVRHADFRVLPDALLAVRETHAEGDRPADVVNEIVRVSPDGSEVLVSGPDFVSDARLAPDGVTLSWLQWDHPNMPWDAAQLVVRAADGTDHVLAGGPGESVVQPVWGDDLALWWFSDRTELLVAVPEAAARGARSSSSTWAPTSPVRSGCSGRAGSRCSPTAGSRSPTAATAPTGSPSSSRTGACASSTCPSAPTGTSPRRARGSSVWPGARPASPSSCGSTWTAESQRSSARPATSASTRPGSRGRSTSRSRPRLADTGIGEAHALVYPPTNPEASAPDGDLPPLMVIVHGGPTSATVPVLNVEVQYWTSRGFCVADVDYRGSTGYGRRYRDALQGRWGILDLDDVVACARHLADSGRVDPARMAIRGGSAGGYTTLAALSMRPGVFTAGASHYGVADLGALAAETHKFESRYLDGLVAPWPSGADVYAERSPINHVDDLDTPLAVFQGDEDAVVPPDQAEAIVAALREKGVPHAYLLFPGEQHGFRKAENIRAALDGELSFYAQVWGFDLPPAERITPIEVVRG